MKQIILPVSDLKLNSFTRLQCISGCVHYKRNPMCPPSCPDFEWFKTLIKSYQTTSVYFKQIIFQNKFELLNERINFQKKIINEEQRYKKEGHFFSLGFLSRPCSLCGDNPTVGRVPICASGIDMMHLCIEHLNISKELSLSYWMPFFSRASKVAYNNIHLCVGMVLI